MLYPVPPGRVSSRSTGKAFTISISLCELIFVAIPSSVLAQCGTQELRASDGESGERFGISVGLSGDRIVVGTSSASPAGAAYIYRLDGSSWVEEAKLTPGDTTSNIDFGVDVAISGDLIVVGAQRDDSQGFNTGSAYVFRREGTSWVQEAKLIPKDAAAGDILGSHLALDGDRVIVSAIGDDDAFEASGSAYIFRREGTSWIEEAKLTASNAEENNSFGFDVAIDDDLAVARGIQGASVYVFRRSGTIWVEETILLVDEVRQFGLDAAAGIIAVGSDENANDEVVVYRHDGFSWVLEAVLTAADGLEGNNFGSAISVSGDTILIGAMEEDGLRGSAYVFRYDGSAWTQTKKLLASDDRAPDDLFGRSVALDGTRAVVGADEHISGGTGVAFVFENIDVPPVADCNENSVNDACDVSLGNNDCNENGNPDECDIADGTSVDCTGNGIPDDCDLSAGVNQDCNTTGIPDTCEIQTGFSEDCNANGVPDECEVREPGNDINNNGELDECEDCNNNGISDGQDITDGTSSDCNSNFVPDECDIADGTSLDNNLNGVPDECEPCPVASIPLTDAYPKIRFLTIEGGDAERLQAVRVTFLDLHAPFDTLNGAVMWVQQAEVFCENAGVERPIDGVCPLAGMEQTEFLGATLGCTPVYQDLTIGAIHVYSEGIVPNSTYHVQIVDATCDLAIPDSYSAPLEMTTSIWGDLVKDCTTSPCGPPDGRVDVVTDVTVILEKFQNLGGHQKVRTKLEPGLVCLGDVSIADVVFALDAFSGRTNYPFPVPQGWAPSPCGG